MTAESELRQSIVNVWGEGSVQVNSFDKMLEKYVRQIAINSELQATNKELKSIDSRERSIIKAHVKMNVLNIIDDVYKVDLDRYKIHFKYMAEIKKRVNKL